MINHSYILPLGSDLPDFWLPDIEGIIVPKDRLLGSSAILVIFMCNHSRYLKHLREVLIRLIFEFQQRGVAVVAINSEDIIQFPDDCPDRMKEDASLYGYSFPYLFDGTQQVARLFGVSAIPDFFIFDKVGKLVYHGQMDDSRPDNDKPVTGKDIRRALDAVLSGKRPLLIQKQTSGSFLKWKTSNEPLI
jgi:peroxiredoxin